MNKEQLQKHLLDNSKERMQLLSTIPYFHALYARYHDPDALEVAKNIGTALAKWKGKDAV